MKLVSACAACCALAFGLMPAQVPQLSMVRIGASPAVETPVAPAGTPAARRPVYRYSVVPGGVADAAELAEIVRSDKVVALHYAGFDLERAQPVTVSAARAVYVSYRKGDQVYWTAKRVMLRPGEMLLSDGRSEMRARCANRISAVPRLPVEPDAPNPESLDVLVFEGAAWEAGLIARVRTPTPKPVPARVVGKPAPGLSLPPAGGFDRPAPPPIHGHPPDIQLLASVSPPPLSGAVTVEPPGPFMPPPELDKGEPPLPEPSPFVPVPDPGRPGPPSNPPLDLPPGTDLPEPATAWLMAVAMVAMVARRGKRRPDAVR